MSSKTQQNTHHKERKYIVCKYVKDHLFVYSFCPFDDAKVRHKKNVGLLFVNRRNVSYKKVIFS